MLRKKIWLAEQSVWKASGGRPHAMPLASGYLKAMVEKDPALRRQVDLRIFSFSGTDSALSVIRELLLAEMPDLVGFSVLGWNFDLFGRVSQTYRQLHPEGWIVWGGTHVSHQGRRIFSTFPAVDIVVDGEGERTFLELVEAFVGGRSRDDLHSVQGITFSPSEGPPMTTAPRPRILDLDEIPSPILTGAIELTDAAGDFAYRTGLLETNRGCPYACAFCYWGGAIAQKIRCFSRDRLAAEMELLGRARAEHLWLCDANFGVLKADEEFLEICIETRETFGYPRRIMTSWAKNKGKIFYSIVRRMKEAGFHTAFNLALQSTSEPVLEAMGRTNMKVNAWEDLARWLQEEGLDVYGELIWGCPGESRETFLEGYDRLARHVTRIAVYPLLLLPNTGYSERREEHGFVTWRTREHDFELVLSHDTMTIEQNREMHRFLFWARVVAEHLVFRHLWNPLFELAGWTQSRVLLSLDSWLDDQNDEVAHRLRECRGRVVDDLSASARHVESGLELFYGDPALGPLLERWWSEAVVPHTPASGRTFFRDLFRWDWVTRPVYRHSEQDLDDPELPQVEIAGERFYVRSKLRFSYDLERLLEELLRDPETPLLAEPTEVTLYYRVGFCNDMALYHNAHNLEYFGSTTPGVPSSFPLPPAKEPVATFRAGARAESGRAGRAQAPEG